MSETGAAGVSGPTGRRPAVVALPEILLTGDRPTVPIDPGPEMLPIPEPSTPSVWVGAQDPHTLCVQWEMPAGQLDAAKSSSDDGGLHLRVVADAPAPQCVIEERVSPGDSMAFVPVPNAGVPYHAEIGVRTQEGSWKVIADSSPASAPQSSPARDESYAEGYWSSQEISKVASPPPTVPPPAGIDLPGAGFATDWAATPTPAAGHNSHPEPSPTTSPQTPTVRTARRLIRLSLGADSVQESYSSHSLAAGRDAESWEELNESEASALGTFPNPDLPSSEAGPAPENPSSPLAAPAPPKSFWFRINAEVILYGSTEPNATLTIGTQSVKVRPDGTFSFRFALPDGAFPLPVVATAADGSDSRAARVEFRRSTQLQGEVGTHPQDPALKPPLPENCAPGSDIT